MANATTAELAAAAAVEALLRGATVQEAAKAAAESVPDSEPEVERFRAHNVVWGTVRSGDSFFGTPAAGGRG